MGKEKFGELAAIHSGGPTSMHHKRFQRLVEELALVQEWEALWNDGDDHVKRARQIRREEIIHELIASLNSFDRGSFSTFHVAEA